MSKISAGSFEFAAILVVSAGLAQGSAARESVATEPLRPQSSIVVNPDARLSNETSKSTVKKQPATKQPAVKQTATKQPVTARPPKKTAEEEIASAQKEMAREQEDIIRYANSHLQHLRWRQRDCVECYVSSAGSDDSTLAVSDEKKMCVKRWTDFYDKGPVDPRKPDGPKNPVEVRIVVGYLDGDEDSFVSDRVIRQSVVKTLTTPCSPNNLVRACGFKESSDDGDLFEKEVLNPKGEMQKVRVRLTASSYSPSRRINEANPEKQRMQTAVAEKTFYEGIRDADALIYAGHARDGGGPDFSPAVRRSNGTTNFEHYRETEPGLTKLDAAFQAAKVNGQKKRPKIMGFFGCDSERWRGRLQAAAPDSGLLLSATDKIAFETMLGLAYITLDSILWQRCSEEFDRAMNTLMDYREKSLVPITMRNFFDHE